MTLVPVTPPAVEPVTLAEAKAYLRLDQSDEDDLVARLISAAREHVEAMTRVKMITQVWRVVLDDWPVRGVIALPVVPLRAVLAVTVYDADGVPSVLPPSSYLADLASAPGRLRLKQAARPGALLNGVEVEVRAGYGDSPADVPAPLRQAVLQLVAHWFEHREAVVLGAAPALVPGSVAALAGPYRVASL